MPHDILDRQRLQQAFAAVLAALRIPLEQQLLPAHAMLGKTTWSRIESASDEHHFKRNLIVRTAASATLPSARDKSAAMHPRLLRSLSIAIAIAGDDLARLSAEEMDVARRAASVISWAKDFEFPEPSHPPEAAIHDSGEHVHLNAAYSWLRPARGGLKRALVFAKTSATLIRSPEAEAPVQVLLRTPSGGTIDVRKSGGRWLRPVLAPGEFRAATLREFAAAVASGTPWRDRPYEVVDIRSDAHGRGIPRYESLLRLDDIAIEAEPQTRAEKASVTERDEAVRQAFRNLVVIGDRVYVETESPRLQLSGPHFGPAVPTWRLGSLLGVEPQETLLHDKDSRNAFPKSFSPDQPAPDWSIEAEPFVRLARDGMADVSAPALPVLAFTADNAPLAGLPTASDVAAIMPAVSTALARLAQTCNLYFKTGPAPQRIEHAVRQCQEACSREDGEDALKRLQAVVDLFAQCEDAVEKSGLAVPAMLDTMDRAVEHSRLALQAAQEGVKKAFGDRIPEDDATISNAFSP